MSKTPKDPTTPTTIYCLIDPTTRFVRYVGKTVKALEYRITSHIYDADTLRSRTHKTWWLRSLFSQGLIPDADVLEICPWNESQSAEQRWIRLFRDMEMPLVNHTDGGEGLLGAERGRGFGRHLSSVLRRNIGVEVSQYAISGEYIATFPSVADASDATGESRTKIVAVCKGRRRKTKRFRWSYQRVLCLPPLPRKDFKHAWSDFVGQTFGSLTVVERARGRSSNGSLLWVCECVCGALLTTETGRLSRGQKRSCKGGKLCQTADARA